MLIDIIIVFLTVAAAIRGKEIGFTRQLSSTVGFFVGLWLGALLEPHTISLVHSQASRGLVAILTTLGMAMIFLTLGEYAGFHLKHRFVVKKFNSYDVGLGSLVGVITLLVSTWLLAAVSLSLALPNDLQQQVDQSRSITTLNKILPDAPTLIANLGQLINPNGFPAVFSGSEPAPKSLANLPSLGDLKTAVDADRASVVKIIGQGCGGLVDGSGFVVAKDVLVTNAHVVAGTKQVRVQDENGTHKGRVVWFDPDLDLAIIRAQGLAGKPLTLNTDIAKTGTATAVLGYPGGGSFTAKAGAVLDQFAASGRNIYGNASANREVYEVQADIIPGNSGGPMVDERGNVLGVIFAESTSYKQVGYALTSSSIATSVQRATSLQRQVDTSRCAK